MLYTLKKNKKIIYEVRIETQQHYFERGEEKYYMYPGTQVFAMIEIGQEQLQTIYLILLEVTSTEL